MSLLSKLYKVDLISPRGIFLFIGSILKNGINIFTFLDFAASINKSKLAIKDEKQALSYKELYEATKYFAVDLQKKYAIKKKSKVGIIISNEVDFVVVCFAASSLGADVYLINSEYGKSQFGEIFQNTNFDLVIASSQNIEKIEKYFEKKSRIPITEFCCNVVRVKNLSAVYLRKKSIGNINILTGGTSGKIKIAKRKTSAFDFINPFFSLLTELDLDIFRSVLIPIPLFHGFGFSTLLVGLILGKEIFLMQNYETNKFCEIIEKYRIEVVTVVPTIIQRFIDCEQDLSSIKRIITGGAEISPMTVNKCFDKFGDVLFNLYGTTEAGFSVMSTPEMLRKYPTTVGKPIKGVKLSIIDENGGKLKNKEVGIILLKTKWSMNNKIQTDISTGDLGMMNDENLLFLAGRADNMIVSGGENVYPIRIENIIMQHSEIADAAVVGVDDSEFGKRLRAFIVSRNSNLTEADLRDWLKGRVARFEMPRDIIFIDEIPLTSVGKKDRRKLMCDE